MAVDMARQKCTNVPESAYQAVVDVVVTVHLPAMRQSVSSIRRGCRGSDGSIFQKHASVACDVWDDLLVVTKGTTSLRPCLG